MWAQIVKTRMKQGAEQEMNEIRGQMRANISRREGLVASYWMRNRNDPQQFFIVAVFESEEQARAGEGELAQDPTFQRARSLEEGTPEYFDLDVVEAIP